MKYVTFCVPRLTREAMSKEGLVATLDDPRRQIKRGFSDLRHEKLNS